MTFNYSDLFIDPRLDYPHLSPSLSFSDYIEQCKTFIKKTRLDLESNAKNIIDSNAPFELRPEPNTEQTNKEATSPEKPSTQNPPSRKIKQGALLIHGLLDSPFTMRDIGRELQANGLLVRAVLLPGHGTLPGALLHTQYKEWVDTVRYGVETLVKEVDQIFLVGFSTGGTLALYHAEKYPEKIAGVVLISPALKINSSFDFLAKWPATLGKIWPRAAWFHRDKEETLDYTRYRSTPFNAAYQVYRLAKEVTKMPSPTCPLFFILGPGDLTVLSKISIDYFLKNKNSKNRMLLYVNDSVNPYQDSRIIVRSSRFMNKRIQDFSHITIPIAPNNLYYGMNGDFFEASRIEDDKPILYGEYYIPLMNFHNRLYKLKLVRYQHQRLTFNPDFAFLSEQIKNFIANA